MSKIIALITAGGSGFRMRTDMRKQYIEIKNKPILAHTINKFHIIDEIDEIAVTVPVEDIDFVKTNIIEKFNFKKVKYLISGGEKRQDSVFQALKSIIADDNDIILIHDGVRPFISHDIILNCIRSLDTSDGSIVGIEPVNTIKAFTTGGTISETLDRSGLISVQTPQTFKFGFIKKCHELASLEKFYATDDSALVEKFGRELLGRKPIISVVEGSSFNIKITNQNDLVIASALLEHLSV
ncbi:MAG: 2-C-methyl-D-erythritol 4-phosphate cytidylyltransferase [Candidatus Delongbacteria bacterium]|nr:2-C-methyl-D-erythritol 4-phosphate cytidylyltransferase [Candidatus Delongbacteria bacterium]MCG2759750.1 2-C-methyl-D-erythritol 4-phosphate cytidylyltransferase [Candidatus Delongbacteria bacterium]